MEELRVRKLPNHLAVIMDGNGRWAERRSLPRIEGHRQGSAAVRRTVRACRRWGIPILTLYAFSLENWQRPVTEVNALMTLLKEYLVSERQEMLDTKIRLRVIGRVEDLDADIRDLLRDTIDATSHCNGMVLNLAISYSGRSEIMRATRQIADDVVSGRLDPRNLTEQLFASYLDTGGLADPDLLIRTSGEQRISNFLLWQMAYTEIYFTDTFWPDFSEAELMKALSVYETRERRFGRLSEQLIESAREIAEKTSRG